MKVNLFLWHDFRYGLGIVQRLKKMKIVEIKICLVKEKKYINKFNFEII